MQKRYWKHQILVMVKQWYYQNVRYAEVKNQEAKGLLTNLGLRTSLSKVRILGDILFWGIKWMK